MLKQNTSEGWRTYLHRSRQLIYRHVLHADDPPHRIALGIAIGVFVSFTPTIGIQVLIAGVLCWLLRANKVVGIAMVFLTNPFTVVPTYYACFCVGRSILGGESMGWAWWSELHHPPAGWWPTMMFLWTRVGEVAAPLWLGTIIVGGTSGLACYMVALPVVRLYRLRRWGQLIPPDTMVAVPENSESPV